MTLRTQMTNGLLELSFVLANDIINAAVGKISQILNMLHCSYSSEEARNDVPLV